ncbi:hypothetical protein Tco_1119240 [Tanacetum coccineum]
MSCLSHFVNHALETGLTTTTPLSRHNGKEKVTLDDLFLLHSIDGGVRVDVPWHVGICMYNGLGYSELVDDILDNDEDEGAVDAGNDDAEGVRCRPNMSFTNRLRAMDERLDEMETDISRLVSDVDDLTYIVSGMSEQYDQFYGEFEQMRMDQERVHQGVNFMSSTPVYSTTPSQSPSPNPFELFGDANAGPSTSQNQGNDINEE